MAVSITIPADYEATRLAAQPTGRRTSGLMLRPCLETGCRNYADPGQSRCPAHAAARARTVNHRHNQARTSAPGDGAARRARRRLNTAGQGICAHCGTIHQGDALQVDHIVALADGGRDIDDNLQLLCHPHHLAKTNTERQRRAKTGA